MSDSGRAIGDCPHARTRAYCPDCLRAEAADLRRQRDELRSVAESIAEACEGPLPVDLDNVAILCRAALARCT